MTTILGKYRALRPQKGDLLQREDVEVVGRQAFKAWGLSAYQGPEVKPRWSGQSDPRPAGRQPSCGVHKPQELRWYHSKFF